MSPNKSITTRLFTVRWMSKKSKRTKEASKGIWNLIYGDGVCVAYCQSERKRLPKAFGTHLRRWRMRCPLPKRAKEASKGIWNSSTAMAYALPVAKAGERGFQRRLEPAYRAELKAAGVRKRWRIG